MSLECLEALGEVSSLCVESFSRPSEEWFPSIDVEYVGYYAVPSLDEVSAVLDAVVSSRAFLFQSSRLEPFGSRPVVSPGHNHVGFLDGGLVRVLYSPGESSLFARESMDVYSSSANALLAKEAGVLLPELPYASVRGYEQYLACQEYVVDRLSR